MKRQKQVEGRSYLCSFWHGLAENFDLLTARTGCELSIGLRESYCTHLDLSVRGVKSYRLSRRIVKDSQHDDRGTALNYSWRTISALI